jgi:UDP-glucose:(heptosyl)LPS alpha-1,3-glucosyltransferase
MKIALAIIHADPQRGGAERYTVDLAAALALRGHEVSLVAETFAAPIAGVSAVQLKTSGVSRRGKYLRLLDSVDSHLSRNRYDMVHAMFPVRQCDVYHPHAGIAAEAIVSGHQKHSGLLRRRMARWVNQLNFKRRAFAEVERQLLGSQRPPTVLCLSDYVKATVRKHYALPEEKLATLFNAVDLGKFDPARVDADRGGFAKDAVVGLMIAQDYQRKGLREAILALAKIEDARLVLQVVGKEDPRAYQRLARQLKVEERVRFVGATTDPARFYKSADFFVLPTRHDPCSLVVLEALAMGLPVLSTRFNGACEIMENGKHGFVLDDPQDVDSLAQAMKQMLKKSSRDAMAEACLGLRGKLSYETHVENLLRIYASAKSY